VDEPNRQERAGSCLFTSVKALVVATCLAFALMLTVLIDCSAARVVRETGYIDRVDFVSDGVPPESFGRFRKWSHPRLVAIVFCQSGQIVHATCSQNDGLPPALGQVVVEYRCGVLSNYNGRLLDEGNAD